MSGSSWHIRQSSFSWAATGENVQRRRAARSHPVLREVEGWREMFTWTGCGLEDADASDFRVV